MVFQQQAVLFARTPNTPHNGARSKYTNINDHFENNAFMLDSNTDWSCSNNRSVLQISVGRSAADPAAIARKINVKRVT
jgi:hypothetical protein